MAGTNNFPAIDDIGVIGYTLHGGCVVITQTDDGGYRIAYHAQDGMPETSSDIFETLEKTHEAMAQIRINGEWAPMEEIEQ
jgi:hypothetical protein